jgi:hypothetical protein
VSRVAALAMKRGKSVDFTGYWQRHVANYGSRNRPQRGECVLAALGPPQENVTNLRSGHIRYRRAIPFYSLPHLYRRVACCELCKWPNSA